MVSDVQGSCARKRTLRRDRVRPAKCRAGMLRLSVLTLLILFLLDLAGPFLGAQAARAESLAVPVASHARIRGDSTVTRFEADLTFAIPFNVYVKKDPYRVFIDLPAVDFRFGAGAGRKGRGLIRAFRYGRMGEDRARIVLDVDGPVLIRRSYVHHARDGLPARMGVELIRTDAETFAALLQNSETDRAPQPKHGAGQGDDALEKERQQVAAAYRHLIEQALKDEGLNPAERPNPALDPLLKNDPLGLDAAEVRTGESSKKAETRKTAQEKRDKATAKRPRADGRGGKEVGPSSAGSRKALSNRRPLIVIDPGHGGKDPGAIGWKNVREKDLVLAFARDLARALKRSGRYRVLLTRSGDSFLTLRQRVDFARRHGAQLFISIHADKFRSGAARGLAVYTLSEEASDEEAAELARSENAADIIDGVDLGAEEEAVKDILIDLAMRETKNRSVHFARTLTRSLKGAVKLRTRPIRSADFRVLRNPDVPAVLIELGYVSNPRDVRNMQSPAWRRRAAAAMARAVKRHIETQVALEHR